MPDKFAEKRKYYKIIWQILTTFGRIYMTVHIKIIGGEVLKMYYKEYGNTD